MSRSYGLIFAAAIALSGGCDDNSTGSTAADTGAYGGSGGTGAVGGIGGTGGTGGMGGTGATGGVGGAGATGGTGGSGGGVYQSQKSNLRFKGPYRLQRELSQMLELPTDGICRELDRYDCIGFVHHISLGGVDAYDANVYAPFDGTSISAPMVMERIALQACDRRLQLDLSGQSPPVLFLAVPATADELRLADVSDPAVETAIQHAFHRLLLRDATPDEVVSFRQLYRDIEGHPDSTAPLMDWAKLSCMALMTSTEFLFY